MFQAAFPQLLDDTVPGGVLAEIVIGDVVFAVSRDEDLRLHFLHASPGVGTRQATIDLHDLISDTPCDQFVVFLVWSPDQLGLTIGRGDGAGNLVEGKGTAAPFSLQVGRDGNVYRVGDEGVEIMGLRVYAQGEAVLSPPAIKLWDDMLTVVTTLLTGRSDIGYLYEIVTANAVLTALVTGLESYQRQRFIELEREGLSPDVSEILALFLSREEYERFQAGEEIDFIRKAVMRGVTPTQLLAEKRINFQNYDDAKRAYNRGYKIKFGELETITSSDLEELQRLIRYRHRIIHVSPLLGMLNAPESPPETPYFANRESADRYISAFSKFVLALHNRTLSLRPPG